MDISMRSVICSSVIALAIAQYYDPTTRDYTELCTEFAEIAQDKYCQLFDMCCERNANNKLNGDKCQFADSSNGCLLTPEGGIEMLRCKAYNCTPEVTTTTTTTTTTQPPSVSAAPPLSMFL
ncbi:hypothetical protein Tcan_07302 [Toxocara canis]|uniref:Uncharacterized protein n=1 Tax=Toxocara canis TaxID=6265 RepID=A0A0B2V8N0_TOXCA|nr:hypothetical protein Tcan_07302 [Toxocara canis]